MDLPAALFSPLLLWSTLLLAVAVCIVCLFQVRWRELPHAGLNAWMGACVMLMALWLLKGGVRPGLSFHLLGACLFTLMMGPWLALPALLLVAAAMAAGGHGDWLALGINWWLSAALPVALASLALWLSRRYLPPNLFIYVFINGFMAGGASLFLAGAAGVLTLGLNGVYDWDLLLDEGLPFYFLLSWSEAFTTGLMTAVLVVYRPEWVATFDDSRYLKD